MYFLRVLVYPLRVKYYGYGLLGYGALCFLPANQPLAEPGSAGESFRMVQHSGQKAGSAERPLLWKPMGVSSFYLKVETTTWKTYYNAQQLSVGLGLQNLTFIAHH